MNDDDFAEMPRPVLEEEPKRRRKSKSRDEDVGEKKHRRKSKSKSHKPESGERRRSESGDPRQSERSSSEHGDHRKSEKGELRRSQSEVSRKIELSSSEHGDHRKSEKGELRISQSGDPRKSERSSIEHGEHRKSEKGELRRSENKKKKKKRKASRSDRHDNDNGDGGRNPREPSGDLSMGLEDTSDGQFRNDGARGPMRRANSTIIPNLASLMGPSIAMSIEEPLAPQDTQKTSMEDHIELIKQRGQRKREATRRMDEQCNDSSIPVECAAIAGSPEETKSGAVAISAESEFLPRQQAKSDFPNVAYSADSHGSSRVGAVAVTDGSRNGKRGPSVSDVGAESYDSRVGAVSVSSAAPRGKGGPSVSSGAESYNSRVGAVSVSSAAPRGKGGPSVSSGAESYNPRVGAVSVPSAAPRGKGSPSVSSGAESYDSRAGAISVPSPAPQGKRTLTGSARHQSSPSNRPRVGTMAALDRNRRQSTGGIPPRGLEAVESRRASMDNANLSESASQKGRLSHFPTSDVHPSLTSLPEDRTDRKGRISEIACEENYEEDADDDRFYHRASNVNRAGNVTMQNAKSGKKVASGPSYSPSGETYERDSAAASLRSGISPSAQHPDSLSELEEIYKRSTGAFSIAGVTVNGRQPGALSTANHDGVREAEVAPNDIIDEERGTSDNGDKPWYRSRTCLSIALLLVVIGGILGLVLPLAVFKDNGGGGSSAPTLSPTKGLDLERQAAVRTVLLDVTDPDTLDDPWSPQNAAYDWIVMDDSLSSVTPGSVSPKERDALVSRYSLATFYFATNGDRWVFNSGWLDGELDECSWIFLSCDNEQVSKIDARLDNNVAGSVPSELKELTSLSKSWPPDATSIHLHADSHVFPFSRSCASFQQDI